MNLEQVKMSLLYIDESESDDSLESGLNFTKSRSSLVSKLTKKSGMRRIKVGEQLNGLPRNTSSMEGLHRAEPEDDQMSCSSEAPAIEYASEAEWLTLNVGGTMFLTRRSTLRQIPDTILAELTEDGPFYHPPSGQYLFDRNPDIFQYILDYYRTDQLHFPHNLCGPTLKKELDYWGIEEKNLATCCWNHYREFSEQEETLEKLGSAFNTVDRFEDKKRNFLMSQIHKWRARIWYFLEDPKSSIGAQIWAVLYILMILISVLSLTFDTHQQFRVRVGLHQDRLSDTNHTCDTAHPKMYVRDCTNPHPAMYWTEFIISTLFAVDLCTRLIVCPDKIRFLKSYFNWLDIVVVVSQWTVLGIARQDNFWEDRTMQSVYRIFSLVRICRVFLIFKLARHYTGLRILILALKASFKEMILLTIFIMIGMVIFSTLIFYAEFNRPQQFEDIPTGFWWAIVTMTTVGYGDVHPTTAYGYVVGALCALSGMLVTGLPIPIIANNFSLYYTVSKLKKRLDEREELKRVTSTEVLNTMKNVMNKVNPLNKIKGMNFNPVSRVKGLVAFSSKQNSVNNSAGQSAETSQQGTPSSPKKAVLQPRSHDLSPIDSHNGDVEAQQPPAILSPTTEDTDPGPSAPPHHLPPITTVHSQNQGPQSDDASIDVGVSKA